MLLSLFGLAGGIGMPMQTSINAQLGKRMGSPFIAAMLNFMIGLGALLIITSIWEHGLAIPVGAIMAAPPWILMGGMLAVVFVTGNILLMPRIGRVQTAILPAMGQIFMGTLIDTFGLFESHQRDLTPLRLVGVGLVIAGVLTVILAKAGSAGLRKKPTETVSHVWLWRAFGLIIGMCMASQTAVNSHLGIVTDSRLFASVINFTVGTTLLIVLNIRESPFLDLDRRTVRSSFRCGKHHCGTDSRHRDGSGDPSHRAHDRRTAGGPVRAVPVSQKTSRKAGDPGSPHHDLRCGFIPPGMRPDGRTCQQDRGTAAISRTD